MAGEVTPTSPNWRKTPAVQAANAAENSLKKIPLPESPDTLMPPQVPAATALLATFVMKLNDAEKAIAKIKADQVERDRRIAELTALRDSLSNKIVDVWCATYTIDLAVGTAVKTMEVPGYWIGDWVDKTAVLFEGKPSQRTVVYQERSLNIAPRGSDFPLHGRIRSSEAMTAAAVFWNAAMEPGHLKWKPLWRYGIVLTDSTSNDATGKCTVRLNPSGARPESGDPVAGLSLNVFNGEDILTDVPISYPPCGAGVFDIGDEVLIKFGSQDRAVPVVIGFRRKPKTCTGWSWNQLR